MPNRIILLSLFIFSATLLLATGPSYAQVTIDPVSINESGSVLCKVNYSFNDMGAHMQMPITYIWMVIHPSGRIDEFPWHYLDAFSDIYLDAPGGYDYEALQEEVDKWDSLYESAGCANPPESLKPIMEKYGFSEDNADDYYIGSAMTYLEFIEAFGPSSVQKTIGGHQSISDFKSIFCEYLFPAFIITSNKMSWIEEDNVGAEFDFFLTVSGVEGEITHEMIDIDGIIFLGPKEEGSK